MQFGQNLLDLERQLTGTGIYTAILPVGKDGLTIAELADGDLTGDLVKEGPYVWSRAGVAKYGWICPGPTDWQDVTVAANLQSYAAARLATSGWALEESITCKAIDLHVTDAAVAAWRVGRYTMLATTPHGIRAAMPLLQMHVDLLDPAQPTVTMGRTRRTFTDDVEGGRRKVTQEMEETRTSMDERINTVRQILTERMTQISQSDRQILLEALEQYVEIGDFESYKRVMDATLAVLPDQIRMEVSEEITEQVEDATGDIRQSVRNMNQYMSFTAAMGMLLGSEGDPVKVQINNQGLNILRETLALLSINQRGVYTPSLYIRPMDPDDPTAGCLYLGNLVEYGATPDIFSHPLHPYTKALFSAIPIPDPTIRRERIVLQGSIPSPANPPAGCKFHTRCSECMEICKHEDPKPRDMGDGHKVKCHLYDEV